MRQIRVTPLHLQEVKQLIKHGNFEAMFQEYGLQLESLDHIIERKWSVDVIDRGCFFSGGKRDGSTRYLVPSALRVKKMQK